MFEQHRIVSNCDVLCLTDTQTYSMEGYMRCIGISHCPMTVREDGRVMLFAGRDIEGKDLGMTINDHLGEGEHCWRFIEKNIDPVVVALPLQQHERVGSGNRLQASTACSRANCACTA
ncbi:hypothetical protein MTO96_006491 [Rhipicephalus appendiculatus]